MSKVCYQGRMLMFAKIRRKTTPNMAKSDENRFSPISRARGNCMKNALAYSKYTTKGVPMQNWGEINIGHSGGSPLNVPYLGPHNSRTEAGIRTLSLPLARGRFPLKI